MIMFSDSSDASSGISLIKGCSLSPLLIQPIYSYKSKSQYLRYPMVSRLIQINLRLIMDIYDWRVCQETHLAGSNILFNQN